MIGITVAILVASVGALSAHAENVRTNVAETARARAVSVDDARVPAMIAPAYRDFVRMCEQKTATRGDLIGLKRFIAASALDEAAKKTWTQKARKIYQESRGKRSKVRCQTTE